MKEKNKRGVIVRVGILGGGLSGITLQYLLNYESEILEKEERPGGLCRTFNKAGFLYDVGGHILFSKDEEIMGFVREVLGKNINYCKRDSKIFLKDKYIKYPFENGLGALDKEDIFDCLIGYFKNNHPIPSNFLEWILHTFGDGIANLYLIPYNEKIWKTKLSEIGTEWVERVPRPPMEDVLKSALGIETEGYVHQLFFNYPSYGGIEELVKALINENSNIVTGFEINRICKVGSEWLVSDGIKERYYDKLVLTFSIKEAIKCLHDVPDHVQDAIKALKHNSVRVVLVGVNNESLTDRGAIYIPSSDVVTHRVCFMNYFSKNNVPTGKSSLMAEVTTNNGNYLSDVSDDDLIQNVVDDLSKVGMLNKQDIIVTDIKNFEYGYVVYDLEYQKNIKIIRNYFEEIGIELHGRFAEFDYINMDEVIKRSIRIANKLNSTILR